MSNQTALPDKRNANPIVCEHPTALLPKLTLAWSPPPPIACPPYLLLPPNPAAGKKET